MTLTTATRSVTMVSILIFYLFCFPCSSIALSFSFLTKLSLPPKARGPESFAFDRLGRGPYTGVFDGRTLKYEGPNVGFVDYASVSSRSKAVCDGNTDLPALGGICGRPIGMGFRLSTGELFIADGILGLLVAGTNGGVARLLVSGAEGQPFKFLNGLDVDQFTGTVYAVDTSGRFNISEFERDFPVNDSTGRLIKYEPDTNITTVLLRNLTGPAGVAVSSDGSFVLFTEFTAQRVRKYWLKGPKANTSEVLVNFEGRPNNIKRTASGNFWIGVNVQNSTSQTVVPRAIQINKFGQVLVNISLSNNQYYYNTSISEVNEFGGALYIGAYNFVGVFRIG